MDAGFRISHLKLINSDYFQTKYVFAVGQCDQSTNIGTWEPKKHFQKLNLDLTSSLRGYHPQPRASIGPENWASLDPAVFTIFYQKISGTVHYQVPISVE